HGFGWSIQRDDHFLFVTFGTVEESFTLQKPAGFVSHAFTDSAQHAGFTIATFRIVHAGNQVIQAIHDIAVPWQLISVESRRYDLHQSFCKISSYRIDIPDRRGLCDAGVSARFWISLLNPCILIRLGRRQSDFLQCLDNLWTPCSGFLTPSAAA